MYKLIVLVIVGALMAACGGEGGQTTPPNSDSGTSVNPPSDGGTPTADTAAQPDSTPTPADAAVLNDVPPQEDVPTPPIDTTPPGEECWSQACGDQWLVTQGQGTAEAVHLPCDMSTREIGLSPAGPRCIGSCSGDVCNCVPDGVMRHPVMLRNEREMDGSCGRGSVLFEMIDGMPVRTSRHLLRRE